MSSHLDLVEERIQHLEGMVLGKNVHNKNNLLKESSLCSLCPASYSPAAGGQAVVSFHGLLFAAAGSSRSLRSLHQWNYIRRAPAIASSPSAAARSPLHHPPETRPCS